MAQTLSNLLQTIYSDLGQTPKNIGSFSATTNSTATQFVNTDWQYLENPPETDSLKGMYLFVASDAGGLSASPEGKWRRITGYTDSTYTGTIATTTDAITAGDRCVIAKQDLFPIEEVITRVKFVGPQIISPNLCRVIRIGISNRKPRSASLSCCYGLRIPPRSPIPYPDCYRIALREITKSIYRNGSSSNLSESVS